jgi:hypothetical protein
LLPLLLIAARPGRPWLITGIVIAVLGLAIRAWASGYVKKNRELTVSGPYSYTRNPLYLGTFLLGLGVAISTSSLWFIVVFLFLYMLIYVPVMMAERDTLRRLFPLEYAGYEKEVPLFLPRITPNEALNKKSGPEQVVDRPRFEWAGYVRHREYRATIGAVFIYALMAIKFLLEL